MQSTGSGNIFTLVQGWANYDPQGSHMHRDSSLHISSTPTNRAGVKKCGARFETLLRGPTQWLCMQR